ncbi:MAG: DUF3772 domain-containing protein [Pseudomonadota bacterium]
MRICVKLIRFCALWLLVGLGLSTAIVAQPIDVAPQTKAATALYPPSLTDEVDRQSKELERFQKAVERLRKNSAALERQQALIEDFVGRVEDTKSRLEPFRASVDRQLQNLGDPPKDGSEGPVIASEREKLAQARSKLTDAQQASDLTIFRSGQLVQRIQNLQLSNFSDGILQRSQSIVSADHWSKLWQAMPRFGIQLSTIAELWLSTVRAHIVKFAIVILLALGAYFYLARQRERFLVRNFVEPQDPLPSFFQRVKSASVLVLVMALPGTFAIILLFLSADAVAVWQDTIRSLFRSALISGLIFLAATALAFAILLPRRPSWRLIGAPTPSVRRLLLISNLIAAVFAIDLFLNDGIRVFHLPVVAGITATSLANIAFAGLLLALVWTPMPEDSARTSARLVSNVLWWLRIPAVIIAAGIIAATLFGYVSLGRFVAGQVMLMGVGGTFVLLLHLAIRALSANPSGVTEPVERIFKHGDVLTERRRGLIASILAFFLNALLVCSVLFLLLLSWGVPYSQLSDQVQSLFFGFEIGQFRISLARILIGIGLFVAVLFVTRLLQGWLTSSINAGSKVDSGIANSLHTGMGYLGIGVATLVGLSYSGIDLSNFTVVIGALSLGVGLGLQTIVNNFVSGIILLIERPIKVGDWIVVDDQQGYVRKISVRSTEIETFDRASVIVPNSSLISGSVQNWTHRNALGRLVVKIGVSYNADPHQVREVLIEVAKSTEGVLNFPEPSVSFDDFGASSLDFTLRCFIADVNYSLSAKTQLRLAIFERFKELNIEIPFPQQDIHLRDLDAVRGFLSKMAEQRAAQEAAAVNKDE